MEIHIGTKCVQGGYDPDNGAPRQIPLIQSTTFNYESSVEMAKLFDFEGEGYFYTRLGNPTSDAVAAKIAGLEGGVGALLTSTGMAASFVSVFNIASAGDHIVASSAIYGGTYNLFTVTLKRMGIDCTLIHPHCSDEELEAAFRPNTKVVFAESLSNPTLIVLDIERFAKAAHAHGVPLIVDNTFPTPVNCRPIEWGADMVVHSTSKYMDGHATAMGGVIVDSGNFDWMAHAEKFPGLTTPDESYHGIVYAEHFGNAGAYLGKAVAQLMRDLGPVPSPSNSFYLNLGLESLHVRMKRHCENGQAVAEHLASHPKVSWVSFCGLPDDPAHELAMKYMPGGSSGVVSFGIAGGREAATVFMDSLELASIVTHVADARTSCLHPASTTHRQLTDEQLRDAGVLPEMIRFSCGLEDAEDIIADIDQALAKA